VWDLVKRIEADPSVDGVEKFSVGDFRLYVDDRWWIAYFISSQPGRILITAVIPRT